MIAFSLAVLSVVAGGVSAGYAGSNSGNDLGYGGSGDSYGYGYSGTFSGSEPVPNFEFPGFDFPGFVGNYVNSLSRHHEDFIRNLQAHVGYGQPGGYSGGFGGSFGSGNDGAFSGSYSGPETYSYSSPNTGPRVYPESINFAQRGAFGGPGSGAASSSASIGPGGVHQTAAVYPENPKKPNVNTRYAAPAGGAFRSVITASESRTSSVGGKPVTVQKAQTTVNDNGKVTTYIVENP
ncbi:heterogeneous nuclear ribonucleoprotein A3 homolog 1 isoform X2 [Anoplophora glabripennis]|uniref:heterogeneous nuclear ribonucleoprotein A3 homolog 1 isoform X2 n=1 Tax=Anoplophora glabripennis TaxID=217634 RepID=UPI0008742E93|nr:heterogeneous nuclear ribonucleoprotein A3 homolog 1 isoform X2 [Anoplophora glabripennis]